MITFEHVGKNYKLFHKNKDFSTLVETLSGLARGLFTKADKDQYEEFWALKDINLRIEEGDRVALIGKNGAGKSTLLKLISRITDPTTGKIKIRGRVASLLEVGTGFHLELTGRENIFLNGAILGMSRKEIVRKFDEIVHFSEMEKFLDTPVKRYSSGMMTRLGFAVAAHLDPDIFIVDEVLAVGDQQFQEKCLNKLNKIGNEGRTIIFVSHNIGSVLSLCTKGFVLEKGQIAHAGPIDTCVNAYLNSFGSQKHLWKGNVGDEHIRFYGAALVNENMNKFLSRRGKISLEIDYEILQPNSRLIVGFGIWNKRNQMLARAHTIDDPLNPHKFQKKGRYTLCFPIDGDSLHEGEYLVKIECFLHNRKVITKEDIALQLSVLTEDVKFECTQMDRHECVSLGHHWQLVSKESHD